MLMPTFGGGKMSDNASGVRHFLILSGLLALLSSPASANVLGVNYHNFFPSPAQTDYITVHSTESIRAGKWRAHVYSSFSGNNVFAYDLPASTQRTHSVSDQLATAAVGVAYGITSQLEYGVSLPLELNHTMTPASDRRYLTHRGVTMIHNQFKYVFKRRGESSADPSGHAIVASLDLPNTPQDGFLGDELTPIVTVEGVYDQGTEAESYSLNLGYRWRSPGEHFYDSPVFPLQDQLIFSGAYQRQFEKHPKLSWMAEFYGAFPIDKGEYARAKDISSAEALFGLRLSPSKSYRWTAGCGAEVLKGTMSPDWRLFAGASWDFSWLGGNKDKDALLEEREYYGTSDDITDPMVTTTPPPVVIEDGDRDGIQDDNDMCPRTPRGVRVDQEGCPLDSDNDSIPDYEDKCPRTPPGEVVNGRGCKALK